MIANNGRSIALIQRLKPQCLRAPAGSICPTRVPALYSFLSTLHSEIIASSNPSVTSLQTRSLATRPASRPKAHTGTPAAKKPRAKTAATAKPAASKSGGRKKTAAKKTGAKPKKATKAKKPKKKPTTTKKPRGRVLTAAGKQRKDAKEKRAKVAELKKTALSPPTRGPSSAWTVYTSEKAKGAKSVESVASTIKTSAAEYKNFTPEQREHYNHLANQNKAKYTKAYNDFINSHTPLEIYNANLARLSLKRLLKTSRGFKSNTYPALKDERQVKGIKGPYNIFFNDRHASGDFEGLTISQRGELMGREWKALSAAEKKSYHDRFLVERARYDQERKTVLGLEPKAPRTRKTAA